MYYTAAIDASQTGLEQILEATSRFNPDRFLYALEYKNWDEQKLTLMANEVATYRMKLVDEFDRLKEFSKVFNKEFATMNNKCYSSALTMLHKIRGGISGTKRLFMKFCPRVHRGDICHMIADSPVSAYNKSLISADTYELHLMHFDGYPQCVSGLYNEMEKFFLVLIKCIILCKQMLDEEKKIKSDNKYCKYLFDEFRNKVLREIADIIMLIPRDSEYLSEDRNPAIASRNLYENDESWAPTGFHNYSKTDVKRLVIKQVLDAEQGRDITRKEILLFGDDDQKVHNCRHIIKHFDKLIPDTYHRKNLPAKYIQMFFQYVGIPFKLEYDAVDYFNKMYLSSVTHKFTTVTYQAVNSYKKEVLKDKDGAYKVFENSIKQHFFKSIPLQKAVCF